MAVCWVRKPSKHTFCVVLPTCSSVVVPSLQFPKMWHRIETLHLHHLVCRHHSGNEKHHAQKRGRPCRIYMDLHGLTIWLFNIAMENPL